MMMTSIVPRLCRFPLPPAKSKSISTIRSFSSCPFEVLGLSSAQYQTSRSPVKPSPTYQQVHSAFRKLALLHHPDTSEGRNKDSEDFTRIKEAFDSIVEGPDGIAVLRDSYHEARPEHKSNVSSESQHETNHYASFLHSSLNPSILREVVEAADMSPGGLDRGGMWEYARHVRNMANEDGLPPLRMEGGGEVDQSKKRRRRKK